MKVLHIVLNLDRGAVENWLLRMLGHARSHGAEPVWTFYCQLTEPGELDDMAAKLGARVVHSPVPLDRKLAFMAALRREVRQGRYDVMHCHHDLLNGFYLTATLGLPIGRRVVHAHNADEHLPTSPAKASLLRGPLRRICHSADRIVGISNHTLDTYIGNRARRSGRDLVHYYGVDPDSFAHASGDRIAFRRLIGLPDDSLILLFGGRITPEKNPVFTIDVFERLVAREPRAAVVFAGAGSLEDAVAKRAAELGVADRLRMIGWRSDMPDVMSCCDWFILPRPEQPMEGFGLAVVEAQLAGLRLLLSLGIPDDPLLPGTIARRLSLDASADSWADVAIELLNAPAPSREAARLALRASPMNMDFALEDMMGLYQ